MQKQVPTSLNLNKAYAKLRYEVSCDLTHHISHIARQLNEAGFVFKVLAILFNLVGTLHLNIAVLFFKANGVATYIKIHTVFTCHHFPIPLLPLHLSARGWRIRIGHIGHLTIHKTHGL